VIRRRYGQSDGVPGASRGSAYMACKNGNLVHGLDFEADDIDGALKAIAARPAADGSSVIAVGQSRARLCRAPAGGPDRHREHFRRRVGGPKRTAACAISTT
jgi:hypothetical protein